MCFLCSRCGNASEAYWELPSSPIVEEAILREKSDVVGEGGGERRKRRRTEGEEGGEDAQRRKSNNPNLKGGEK